MKKSYNSFTRRDFLVGSVSAFAGASFVPRYVLGRGMVPPSDKLNIAAIGVGGRGGADLYGVRSENIVALCDVDQRRAAKTFSALPKVPKFRDFRRMLDKMAPAIDAVIVATPDHFHAVAAMAAIQRGKHVYCEKPLAHNIHEVRSLMQAAHDHHVVTQLGNQGHSFEHIRLFCEWIWDGAIGTVREIHAFCGSNYSRIKQLSFLQNTPPVPPQLDWDLWLGPAEYRSYNPVFLPNIWRGWTPFGTGVIGDWVCHVVDPVFWALNLGAPKTIRAEAENYDPQKQGMTFPAGSTVHYEFPARDARPAVKLTWYDGVAKPPRPPELEPQRKIPSTGAIVIGDKGTIMYGSHGAGGCRIIPETKMRAYHQPEHSIPRVQNHYLDWINACKHNGKAGSNFDYGGPLTEIALLGIIALRQLGQTLEWDSANIHFTNCPQANKYLNPPYRIGWSL